MIHNLVKFKDPVAAEDRADNNAKESLLTQMACGHLRLLKLTNDPHVACEDEPTGTSAKEYALILSALMHAYIYGTISVSHGIASMLITDCVLHPANKSSLETQSSATVTESQRAEIGQLKFYMRKSSPVYLVCIVAEFEAQQRENTLTEYEH